MSRFALVGVLNTSVDLAGFSLFFFLIEAPLIAANTLSYALGVSTSFFFNRNWTFARNVYQRSTARQLVAFFCVNVVALALANSVLWLLAQTMPVIAAKFLTVGVTFFWGYWANKRFVFV